jgi:1,4-dihydroxy-2-naphthoyl-CoA synthase
MLGMSSSQLTTSNHFSEGLNPPTINDNAMDRPGIIAAGSTAEFEIRFAPKEVEDFAALLVAWRVGEGMVRSVRCGLTMAIPTGNLVHSY